MDEQRHTALLLLILFLSMLFIVWKGRVDLGGEREQLELANMDLARERQFSEEVFVENQQLREANGKLRLRLVELSQNLSISDARINACMAEPKMRETLANLTSEQHRVHVSDLLVTPDLVTIDLENIKTGIVAPTGSMRPILYEGTIVLEKTPTSTSEVFIGDIVVYEYKGDRIIHRVIRMGWDEEGWFAITRGDNNPSEDPFKIRFSMLRGVVVGIIY